MVGVATEHSYLVRHRRLLSDLVKTRRPESCNQPLGSFRDESAQGAGDVYGDELDSGVTGSWGGDALGTLVTSMQGCVGDFK